MYKLLTQNATLRLLLCDARMHKLQIICACRLIHMYWFICVCVCSCVCLPKHELTKANKQKNQRKNVTESHIHVFSFCFAVDFRLNNGHSPNCMHFFYHLYLYQIKNINCEWSFCIFTFRSKLTTTTKMSITMLYKCNSIEKLYYRLIHRVRQTKNPLEPNRSNSIVLHFFFIHFLNRI